ncbi:MAG: TetR/AcrR family transcriptional regulator [Candidatus Limnocylindrales bacterium]
MKTPESIKGDHPLSGRQAQARRNDPRIREAAREVFTTDPDAPMSAVAARAGVGIGALYRRYRSKEDLLREVARDGLARYLEIAEAAVADDRDPWITFASFMGQLLEAQTVAITMNLAGTFAPDEDLFTMSVRAAELNERIVDRTKAAGGLRPDIVVDDLSLILEQVSSIRLGDERRTRELRRRYLALILDGLRVAADASEQLPGPPPMPDELASRWAPGHEDAAS